MNKPLLEPPAGYVFTPQDNRRVLYICGPHGTGKSTLIHDLASFNKDRVREQIVHVDSDDELTRQVWRIGLHCVEHRENLAFVQTQSKDSVVIGDRCFLDDYNYMEAFVKLGWLERAKREDLVDVTERLYEATGTPTPEKFIILLPPFEWNVARIEERWQAGEPAKWCEHNFEYLKAVRSEFAATAQLLGKKHVKLIEETDRTDRVHKVKEFLVENELEDFIVEGKTIVESHWTGS